MANKYEVKITYGDKTQEKFTITSADIITHETIPKSIPIPERVEVMSAVGRLKAWLAKNGGVKVEIEEKPE